MINDALKRNAEDGLASMPSAIRCARRRSSAPFDVACRIEGAAAGNGPEIATKPFWGTHETILKQSGRTPLGNDEAAKVARRLR
jgi:hypothetical protein